MNNNELEQLNNELKEVETKALTVDKNIDEFKGKNILTFGTFDLLHIGHNKIIEHCIEISGDESKVVVGVSSDAWNLKKNKVSSENENIRMGKIKEYYPNINVILEDHNTFEETWPIIWDEFNIDLIVMGGDHFEKLDYINNVITPKGNKMKIFFFERTPNISSTLIKEMIKKQ